MSLWSTEVYVAENGSSPFSSWLAGLSEAKFGAFDAGLRLVLLERGLELSCSEWLKPLGDGLWEFRVRHDATAINNMFGGEASSSLRREGVLLRVFCHFHGNKIVLLLSGYDKGRDPSEKRQQKEIARTRTCLTAWQEAKKREVARRRKG